MGFSLFLSLLSSISSQDKRTLAGKAISDPKTFAAAAAVTIN
jgi:hypothetical protein